MQSSEFFIVNENCLSAASENLVEIEKKQVNKRNEPLEFNGETKKISAWAKEIGVTTCTMMYRLKFWSVERALTTRPVIRGSNLK